MSSSEGYENTGLPADPQAVPKPEQLDPQTAELLYRQIRQKLGIAREERDSVEKLCETIQSIFNRIEVHTPISQKQQRREAMLQRIFAAANLRAPYSADEAIGITEKRTVAVEERLRAHREAMDTMLARDSAHFLEDFKTIYEAVRDLMPVVNPETATMAGFVEKVKERFNKTVYHLPTTGGVAVQPPLLPRRTIFKVKDEAWLNGGRVVKGTPGLILEPPDGAHPEHYKVAIGDEKGWLHSAYIEITAPLRFENTVQEPTKLQAFLVEHIDMRDLDAPAAFDILKVCLSLFARLAKKNKAYGNSALKPRRILAKSSTVEQIYVRMDDKLNRLIEGEAAGEDPLFDMVGYWVILQVALAYQEE